MQRPQDAGIYQELHGISNFTISDHHSPSRGRSPSHSPAISPRILPQSLPDMGNSAGFALQNQNSPYGPPQAYMQGPGPEAFPSLPQTTMAEMSQMGQQMSAPTIFVESAPAAGPTGFEGKVMDTDALTPPDRGKSHLFGSLVESWGVVCSLISLLTLRLLLQQVVPSDGARTQILITRRPA